MTSPGTPLDRPPVDHDGPAALAAYDAVVGRQERDELLGEPRHTPLPQWPPWSPADRERRRLDLEEAMR